MESFFHTLKTERVHHWAGRFRGRYRRGQHRPNGRFSGLIWPRGSDRIAAPPSAATTA